MQAQRPAIAAVRHTGDPIETVSTGHTDDGWTIIIAGTNIEAGLLEAREDAAGLLQLSDQPFDDVAIAIRVVVKLDQSLLPILIGLTIAITVSICGETAWRIAAGE